METSNLLDAEFKSLVKRMLNELSENFSTKKDQSEMKHTLTKMKNNLQEIKSRVDEAKNQISNFEDKKAKNRPIITAKRIQNNEDSVRSLWDNFKHSNIRIMGVSKGEERKQGIQNLFEKIMTENFPNLVKKIDNQVQEGQKGANKMSHTQTHNN